ncbi:hypothetical protein [Streptomyces sp. NPDC055036]
MPHDVLESLYREHKDDPQKLAEAIVAAAEPDEDGRRDDATVVILQIGEKPKAPGA